MESQRDLFSWVNRGRQRRAVIKAIFDMLMPSQILKKAKNYNQKLTMNNTSDVLRSFVKKGIAVCLNEEAKIGRLYKLTEIGERIRNEILRIESEEYNN